MPNEQHERAQLIAADAALALSQGRRADAVSLYLQAASYEEEALRILPPDKPRTKAILGRSLAALLYKGKNYARAEQTIYTLLAAHEIAEGTVRTELKELLEAVWDEQVISSAGMDYSGEELFVSLRGGLVGSGTAPLDTAIHYMGGMTSLVYRVSEWEGGFGFRQAGLPPREIQDALQARATQPSIGSYQFSIRLVEPSQQWLFPAKKQELTPKKVIDALLAVFRAASSPDPSVLAEVVPDQRYRIAMCKLVRNVLPNSLSLREVEVRTGKSRDEGVLLVPGSRRQLGRYLRKLMPTDKSAPERKVRGILRALHLDKRWLEIALKDGRHERFATKPDELDDVLGPMVNRPVVAYVTRPKRTTKPLISDIELDEGPQQATRSKSSTESAE